MNKSTFAKLLKNNAQHIDVLYPKAKEYVDYMLLLDKANGKYVGPKQHYKEIALMFDSVDGNRIKKK